MNTNSCILASFSYSGQGKCGWGRRWHVKRKIKGKERKDINVTSQSLTMKALQQISDPLSFLDSGLNSSKSRVFPH